MHNDHLNLLNKVLLNKVKFNFRDLSDFHHLLYRKILIKIKIKKSYKIFSLNIKLKAKMHSKGLTPLFF